MESDADFSNFTELLIEGKTKKVFGSKDSKDERVLIVSKDRITAGDGAKAHDLEGKAAISNKTNAVIFELLNNFGMKTAFIKTVSEKSFLATKCAMIPIEWVTRRYATGSFLKRNVNVPEGYKFSPVKLETFYKDDANHDPQWSRESLICAQLLINNCVIGQAEIEIMEKTAICVFEVLEKLWALNGCSLIDMKIEFGVNSKGEILLADVIDSDSWRLWPQMQKANMVDKQVYRDLKTVTKSDLVKIKTNFQWVYEQLNNIKTNLGTRNDHLVVIFMGSISDQEFGTSIRDYCCQLGLQTDMKAISAHKQTEDVLNAIDYYESLGVKIVFIAVAGRSNGLGLVLSGNCDFPVINCPPIAKSVTLSHDIWSSINVPSGLGCVTTLYPEAAALCAAQILALDNASIWARLNVRRLNSLIKSKVVTNQTTMH